MTEIEFEKAYLKGDSRDCYKYLGSHLKADGTEFSVYAPNAKAVSVVGDFNSWTDEPAGKMIKDSLGFWHCFCENVKEGACYKYKITEKSGNVTLKSDPVGFRNELRPNTASIVFDIDRKYSWSDDKWFSEKVGKNYLTSPVNIYEVHAGSWRRGNIPGLTPEESESCKPDEPWLNYRELADSLSEYVSEMGYTHVELMPITEHPLDDSWGYQTLCFYSVTGRYGSPDDLRYFVGKMHEKGIGVIFDWVPGHFCKDASGLYKFDGSFVYESNVTELRENYQWGTANFDFKKGSVVSFLISNAVYFFKEFHVDGLRVDAVTNILLTDYAKERTPALKNKYGEYKNLEGIDFLRKMNRAVFESSTNPLMIAEESGNFPMVTKPPEAGGIGFNFKWNMGWMNDTLEYISMDPIYRQYEHNKMTFSLMYAFDENYILPISHDEVVHGKKSLLDKCFGTYEQKFPELRAYFTYMMGHPGKKLSFMGNEFGPFIEWRFYEELEWKMLLYPPHKELRDYVKLLNNLYKTEKAFYENDDSYYGFEWLNADDNANNTYSFVRKSKNAKDFLIFVINFSPCEHKNYRVPIAKICDYEVLLSSENYNKDVVQKTIKPEGIGSAKKRFSVGLDLRPYEAVILRPVEK